MSDPAPHPGRENSASVTAVSNPFSTRYTRPGAIPFHFSPGPKEKQLIERLWDTGLWGQVIGPHGSGKSTLLQLLSKGAAREGICCVPFDLHDSQRRMPRGWRKRVWEAFEVGRATMVVVDGYEQLSAFSRWRLKQICRQQKWGLLVTAHSDIGFPHLYRTLTHIDLAHALVAFLLPESEKRIASHLVAEVFRRHEGNLREVFADLYDRYEKFR